MGNMRVFKPSFSGGELSPEMFGRIDDGKFQSGAASIENMIATPLGPAEKRPGFEYVNATKNNGIARLIPFAYSPTQTIVIELGNQYARFHTQGQTLRYSTAGIVPWIPGSPGVISYTNTTPAVITWTAHGLTTGNPVRFYVAGAAPIPPLPTGLTLAYTYTVVVIDANTFRLLDASGAPVAFTAPAGVISGTNFPGGGTPSASLSLGPNQGSTVHSSVTNTLASTAVPGGVAVLSAAVSASVYTFQGSGSAVFEYSTNGGATWTSFYGFTNGTGGQATPSVSIPLTNLALLQLRVTVGGSAGPSGSVSISGAIASWSVTIPTGSLATTASLEAYYYYAAGEKVTYGGLTYAAAVADSGGMTVPGTKPAVWYALPADLSYELQTPYAATDLLQIHYTQSADVVTLVHPLYPPQELRRLSATTWTLSPIVFGLALTAPLGVAVVASPGYQAKIATITLANPALITTVTNHTLALGDGIYIKGLTATIGGVATVLDGFFLVNSVPINASGALIPNQLTVMDYSGNVLDASGWSAVAPAATIQYGSKIFNITSQYVVTAVASDGIQQSAISSAVSVLNNLNVTGSFNTITWAAVAGAFQYYVYRQLNGLYGYIGTTLGTTLSFNDNNIAVDMAITPPRYDPVFSKPGDYPGAVSYFQQRRCFAGTQNQPQNLWMTKSGSESDMSYSLPIVATDRIAIGIAVRELSTIQHIVPLLQLILLSGATEISVSPTNTDVITPSTINPRPQSYVGASGVQPTIVNNSLIYCAARGGHVREMGFQWQIGGFITGDIALRAAHLFDNRTIVDQTLMKCPWQVVWFVSSTGDLLGLTYTPEQQIGAWHHHRTDGIFESIACVAEGGEDRLYAVIRRTVNAQTVRYVERMSTRNFPDTSHCFFVDAGATFDGTNLTATTVAGAKNNTPGPLNGTWNLAASAATFAYPAQTDVRSYLVLTGSDGVKYEFNLLSTSSTAAGNAIAVSPIPAGVTFAASAAWAWARATISGLTWLEGKRVLVLADGAVQAPQTVTAGAITIEHPGTLVTIGLPYAPTIETLPLVMQIDGNGQGRVKNINKVWIRVNQASAIYAGPTPTAMVEYKQRTAEPYGSAPNLASEEILIVIPASWATSGQVYITQTDPLPFTVIGLTVEAAIGG